MTYGKHFHSTGVSDDKVLFFSPKFLKRRKVVVLFTKNVKKSSLESIGYKGGFWGFPVVL